MTINKMQLRGRFAVTGAAGGLGAAVAEAIVAAGGTAIRLDRFASAGVSALDVTSPEDADQVISALEAEGGLDGIVLAAGLNAKPQVPFLEMTQAEWNRVVDVNLWGTFNVLQRWAKGRVALGLGGSAVTVASVVARAATTVNAHYVASKGGVDALTRAAATSLGPKGIRVNAVAPGPVPTGMSTNDWSNDEKLAPVLARIPLGRLGTPDDIAQAVVFLLSDASSWTTGTTLFLDGGGSILR